MQQALLFLFAALFVSHAFGQCTLARTYWHGTYKTTNDADQLSGKPFAITFGDIAASNLGAVEVAEVDSNEENSNIVFFSTFTENDGNLIQMRRFGARTQLSPCGTDQRGDYTYEFTADCSQVTFTLSSDECTARSALWNGVVLTKQTLDGTSCVSEGHTFEGQYRNVPGLGPLSEQPFSIMLAKHGYTIEASNQVHFWGRWELSNTNVLTVTYLATTATSDLCAADKNVGLYLVNFESTTSCATSLCVVDDRCENRAALLAEVDLNGSTQSCSEVGGDDYFGECSQPGTKGQWDQHPYDCTDQHGGNTCAYCVQRIHGEDVGLCIDRLGNECEAIFSSSWREVFCNMEFECPASTMTVSVFAVVGLLFVRLFF